MGGGVFFFQVNCWKMKFFLIVLWFEKSDYCVGICAQNKLVDLIDEGWDLNVKIVRVKIQRIGIVVGKCEMHEENDKCNVLRLI